MLRDVLGAKHVRIDGERILPSGLDVGMCSVARCLLGDGVDSVAIALPRGRGPHPALLGLYLALWRLAVRGRMSGSVVVSTGRGEMSKLAREFSFDDTAFKELTPGRLVTENVPNTGGVGMDGHVRPPRKRPAIRPLDRKPRHGISQADGYLLFARPNSLPAVAQNVVWAMVVDTVGTAGPSPWAQDAAEPDSWTRTLTLNRESGRKQLWIGELGDPGFVRFCSENRLPLFTFDWPLIGQLAELGVGSGPMTSGGIVVRSQKRPHVGHRIVNDDERDYLARETYLLLRELRKRGGTSDEPAVVRTAYKLCGLLSRLPCTQQAYDAATGGGFAVTVEQMWNQVDNARASAFIGAKWKEGFNRYWDPLRSNLRKLIKLQQDANTCSKYVALIERLGDAQQANECVRVICQTNAERNAVKATLAEYGVAEETATVHSFGTRFPHGSKRRTVMLLTSPPPPWHASILASGEEGRVEVLCFPHEVARLEARVAEVERDHEAF